MLLPKLTLVSTAVSIITNAAIDAVIATIFLFFFNKEKIAFFFVLSTDSLVLSPLSGGSAFSSLLFDKAYEAVRAKKLLRFFLIFSFSMFLFVFSVDK